MKAIKTDKAPAPIGPYSQAMESGGLIFTSGQIAIDPQTNALIEGGVVEQAKQVFENLKAVLEAAGSDLDHVVKTTIFLKDMNDFSKVNEIYAAYFGKAVPARSTVEVARLPKDVLIEVDCIAEKK
ncbi:RidA family protein [Calditrichota bacterium LG25]|uniref:Endoribonuclease L-PSP n=1 Tax=Caldithrix abyssi DSM 13497 TaxID=880073 RepID=H1XYI6_CALAY|nr:RidA family protein [Caldithrix abyssi]APF19688.1 endoribonuclease L-PSP [Caldithrix abyssi DSM 13497]EHO39804.1 endoribonuclease L-PSP [Caldithrix abyssi DSM 13497]